MPIKRALNRRERKGTLSTKLFLPLRLSAHSAVYIYLIEI